MSVAIMNMALDMLQEEPILTAEDDRAAVRWMNRNFQPVCDSMLRVHPWNFAVRRASLAALSDAPSSGWTRQFQLPADCIRILPATSGYLNGASVPHAIEGRKLLTDSGSPFTLSYIGRVSSESSMDPMFVQALAATLAARAAPFITGKNSLAQTLAQQAQQLTMQAQMVDSLEGTPYEAESDDWVNGRFGDVQL